MTASILEIWRFPVKSMQGECLPHAFLGDRGLLGDRAYGIVDVATGQVASAKRVKQFAGLMACCATFVEPPRAGYEAPPVRIDLPDGQSLRSDCGDADCILSAHFQREVRLVKAAPTVSTYGEYQDATDDMLDSAVGLAGAFKDGHPMSILTTSTLERLQALQPDCRFDPRRFRMNVILQTRQPGFIENEWVGRALEFEQGARIDVTRRDSRCVMTTLPQADLPHEPEVLKTISRHNRISVDAVGKRPCAGVYAQVAACGIVKTGSRVRLDQS